MIYIIDTPTQFDTLETWEEFLASISKLDKDREEVRRAIKEATLMIAEKKRK